MRDQGCCLYPETAAAANAEHLTTSRVCRSSRKTADSISTVVFIIGHLEHRAALVKTNADLKWKVVCQGIFDLHFFMIRIHLSP